MGEFVRSGLKMPKFYRTNGNYDKLQKFINAGEIRPNDYVYDSSTKKLIHINDDKTYNFIGGHLFTTIIGTTGDPVHISDLEDGMYIIQGNYEIANTEVDYCAKAPILVLAERDYEDPTIIHATIYTSSGCTMYKIEEDKTTIDRLVTEETVVGVVSTVVEEQVPDLVEEIMPTVIDDNIRPATDDEIDDMIEHMFPDTLNGGD